LFSNTSTYFYISLKHLFSLATPGPVINIFWYVKRVEKEFGHTMSSYVTVWLMCRRVGKAFNMLGFGEVLLLSKVAPFMTACYIK
jgi:hypothetical protein